MCQSDLAPVRIGRIVPSPKPNYLHALLMDVNDLPGLLDSFMEKQAERSSIPQVRYLAHWKIDSIITALLQSQSDTNDKTPSSTRSYDKMIITDTLNKIQSDVVTGYTRVAEMYKVWKQVGVTDMPVDDDVDDSEDYDSEDNDDIRKRCRLDSDDVHEVGGLMMQSHWRKHLGWKGSISEELRTRGDRYVFYHNIVSHVPDPDGNLNSTLKQVKRKFIWDPEKGKWTRAEDCSIVKEKKRAQRMAALDLEIRNIQEKRDTTLRETGLESILKLTHDGSIDFSSNRTYKKTGAEEVNEPLPSRHIATNSNEPASATRISTDQTRTKRKADTADSSQARKRRVPIKKPRTIRALRHMKR